MNLITREGDGGPETGTCRWTGFWSRDPGGFCQGICTVFNPFTSRVCYGDIEVVLTLSLWMKSYGVTIHMKPRQQYFYMVLFTFKYFTK